MLGTRPKVAHKQEISVVSTLSRIWLSLEFGTGSLVVWNPGRVRLRFCKQNCRSRVALPNGANLSQNHQGNREKNVGKDWASVTGHGNWIARFSLDRTRPLPRVRPPVTRTPSMAPPVISNDVHKSPCTEWTPQTRHSPLQCSTLRPPSSSASSTVLRRAFPAAPPRLRPSQPAQSSALASSTSTSTSLP